MKLLIRILLLLLFVHSPTLYAQRYNLLIEHLSAKEGLSDNYVHCILQDKQGFMWFGTENGLNKFDGHKTTIFRADPNESAHANANHITALFEHSSGHIWIGTNGGGLKILDPKKEVFHYYRSDSISDKGLVQDQVLAICASQSGGTWVGTQGGLQYIETGADGLPVSFKTYRHDPDDPNTIHSDFIYCLKEAKDGSLWIGSNEHGLMRFFPKQEKFSFFIPDWNDPNTLSNLGVMDIFEDGDGRIWISLWNGGINLYDPENEQFIRFRHDPDNPNSIRSDDVYAIRENQNGGYWVATYNGGINVMTAVDKAKNEYTFNPISFDEIGVDYVRDYQTRSLYVDHTDLLWVGTLGGGIKKVFQTPKRFTHFKPQMGWNKLAPMKIVAIAKDEKANVWVGTANNGLYRIASQALQNGFQEPVGQEHIIHLTQQRNQLSGDEVTAIFKDKQNRMWVGTRNGLNRLVRIDKNRFIWKTYTADEHDPYSLFSGWVLSITEDREGTLWVATKDGLNRYDSDQDRFINRNSSSKIIFSHPDITTVDVLYQFPDKRYLLGNSERTFLYDSQKEEMKEVWFRFANYRTYFPAAVLDIYEEPGQDIWIGTRKGVVKYENGKGFTHDFRGHKELSRHTITAIAGMEDGQLWMGSQAGLISFQKESGTITQIDVSDELQANDISPRTGFIGDNGHIWFGAQDGFFSFSPDQIRGNTHKPPVIISDLKFSNLSVKTGEQIDGNLILEQTISSTSKISIPYTQNVFSLEFSALSYLRNQENKYKYRLEELNDKWSYSNADNRTVTYGNLPPGTYTFRVKAANNDGVWNEEGTSLEVKILPPPWKTWWAYSLYGILLFILAYASRQFAVKRIELENELKLERFKREQVSEVNQLKQEFFTNISHELKTPLTLLLSPLDNLMQSPESGNRKLFRMMYRNASKLLKLINQLLDLRKYEVGHVEVNSKEGDLVKSVRQIFLGFSELAEKRQIAFTLKTDYKDLTAWYDPDHLETILENLLSNAFKYTPKGGKIQLRMSEWTEIENPQEKFVIIAVSDNGKGIEPEHLPHIFDRFYQVHETDLPSITNTGIGLSIVKRLVNLNNGDISVESTVNVGTTFRLKLPVTAPRELAAIENEETEVEMVEGNGKPAKNADTVLIVEDNPDLRKLIRNVLGSDCKVREASDGLAGWQIAQKSPPDLIISDIMMPNMDGITFCEKIKSNIVTSHIPVILLTARTTYLHRKKSLEIGADDYITKPFRPELLKIKAANLINSRRKLRRLFSTESQLEPDEITSSSPDKELLERAINIVENHLENPKFDVKQFVTEMGMSRSVLYAKLPSLTGLSPNEFIRVMRLKKAASLLRRQQMTVAEVCYSVGFNTPKYFTKCFREHFGKNPSEFAQSADI